MGTRTVLLCLVVAAPLSCTTDNHYYVYTGTGGAEAGMPAGEAESGETGGGGGTQGGGSGEESGGTTSHPHGTGATEADECAEGPSWNEDIVPFFVDGCGADTKCHDATVYTPKPELECRGWLSLEDVALGAFWGGHQSGCPDLTLPERLIGNTCECQGALKQVIPYEPESSYLFLKMLDGPYCGMSEKMPPPGNEMEFADLTEEQIDMVREWIECGAPFDN